MNKINCHGDTTAGGRFKYPPPEWRAAETAEMEKEGFDTYRQPFRTCSYCGSIHPDDLIEWFAKGASLQKTDWKYGWPHKYYIEGVPNPHAGRPVKVGQNADGSPIIAPAPPTAFGKFYTVHLVDFGPDWLREHGMAIFERTGIMFHILDEKLKAEIPEYANTPLGSLVWARVL